MLLRVWATTMTFYLTQECSYSHSLCNIKQLPCILCFHQLHWLDELSGSPFVVMVCAFKFAAQNKVCL